MTVTVLRMGHRPQRDKRLSTHLLLAARAFGARNAIYTGDKDPHIEKSINGVVENWGGDFTLEYSDSWRKVVNNWKGKVVHLTMYGLPVQETVPEIRQQDEPLLVAVGGPKVPGEMYGLADWNVAVTSQPHSEVSALAIFLNMLNEEQGLSLSYPGARMQIKPSAHGKQMESMG